MDTLQTIFKRKTTRAYENEQISEKELQTVLKAGLAAPVGCNAKDTVQITVIQNKDLMHLINVRANEALNRECRDCFYNAPTVLIIAGQVPSPFNCEAANCACIAENMVLAATELGLGSTYMSGFLGAFKIDENLKGEIGIPDDFEPFAGVALGYAKDPAFPLKEIQITNRVKYIR